MHIELQHINKSFGSFQASKDISFGIEQGKLVALLGPSGSGKTTILRMIAGLEHQDSGDIYIQGKKMNSVPVCDRGIGFVFQNYALFPYYTVFDNIAYGLKLRKMNKVQIKERVEELLELVGLKNLGDRYPDQLSGGQRQRVAFARALAPKPNVLLLDEPFAAIDAKVRQELRSWLRDMIHKIGITSIFVTHDQEEAVEVADEIIITNHGRVEQKGSPKEIYRNPKTPFTARFMGHSLIIPDFGRLHGFRHDETYQKAVIRPEFVKVVKMNHAKYKNSAYENGRIRDISFRGSAYRLTVEVGEILLQTTRTLDQEPVTVGEEVKVLIYQLYAFNESKVELIQNSALQEGEMYYI
ncbi:MAG: sulfate/molybdate ABC transporter ATP-binding protein [Lachnospiraceae bacterium]